MCVSVHEHHNDMPSALQDWSPSGCLHEGRVLATRNSLRLQQFDGRASTQWIAILLGEPVSTDDPALCGRMGTAACGERLVLLARSSEQPDHPGVPLVATGFIVNP